MTQKIRNALAMSAIPVPEKLATEALAELDGLEEQLEATRSALHDLAEECFERMAAADLEAWDAPYRIEYPGDLVERARAVLNPASEPLPDEEHAERVFRSHIGETAGAQDLESE